MKTLKYIFGLSLALLVVWNCSDDDNFDYLNDVAAPSEVTANFLPTLDENTGNLGLITITPNANGAVSYNVNFGDGTEDLAKVNQGENVEHQYAELPEGEFYTVTIEAVGITGLTAVGTEMLEVVFKAPVMSCDIMTDQDIVIVNHESVSKRVDVTVVATYGVSYEVYFGESGFDESIIANNGETIDYTYQEAGTYSIRVIAMSASTQTTECIIEFEVTAILQPISPAPTQPARAESDVISIFSAAYTDVAGTDYFPDWGQAGQGSSWAMFELDSDEMLNYINLSYQGIALADGTTVNVSGMEFLHMDVWTSGDAARIETSLINNASGVTTEAPVWSDLTADEWTTIEIPISDYIDQGLTVTEIFQMKFVGDPWAAGTVFVDNIYFWKEPDPASGLEGTWKLAAEAGALGVGPTPGDTSWWNCDLGCVSDRACFYDDIYVFGLDGSFRNILGSESWIEPWQGGSDACGIPVSPHDGMTTATFLYDSNAGTVTLNGTGAYIGLPKAYNGGELSDPANAPSSITYDITLTDNNNTMIVVIDVGGAFWTYKLVRYVDPIVGSWKLAPEAGALGVGPAPGDVSWWSCDDTCVAGRACFYDDSYVFGSDGSFNNVQGSETWVEPWQGGSDSCATPEAPHDGMGLYSYFYDENAGTINLNGIGAYIGLPKAYNGGELSDPANAPSSITYDVSLIDNNTMNVVIDVGGAFWNYKLIRE
jgi:hypothetical protein